MKIFHGIDGNSFRKKFGVKVGKAKELCCIICGMDMICLFVAEFLFVSIFFCPPPPQHFYFIMSTLNVKIVGNYRYFL